MSMPEVRVFTLRNGITFHVYNGGDSDVNRLSVAIEGGEAEDSPSRLFNLINTVSTEGTATRSAEEVADVFDYNGSWLTSTVTVHHSVRTFFSLNSRMDSVLPLVSDIVENPAFRDHQVEVAAEKAARAIELRRQKVKHNSSHLLDTMLFSSGSPMASEANPDYVRNISADELRQRYAASMNPRCVNVFLSGRISSDMENCVISAFESLKPAGNGVSLLPVQFAPEGGPRVEWVRRPGVLQSSIDAGIPLIGRNHPDYDMLRIAVVVLGGYFGSRLMLNVREDKGYTYGIGAALYGYAGCGQLRISTETDNSHVAAVIDEIRSEMRAMHDASGYTEEELVRVRSFLKSSLASQLDSPFAIMDYHQNHLLSSTPGDYFERQQRTIDAMSPETLADVSARYLDPGCLYVAVAGDDRPS